MTDGLNFFVKINITYTILIIALLKIYKSIDYKN